MTNEDSREQFVTAPYLARVLAKDPSFVSEIGLDGYQPDQIVQGLEDIVGFILAMYNAAMNIFETYDTLTLDEKFVRLIYSRFVLEPELVKIRPDILKYAQECYEEIKSYPDRSQCKWDDMSLYTKFFEICVRVLIEESYNDIRMSQPDMCLSKDENDYYKLRDPMASLGIDMGTREVLEVAFKGVFSYVNWELQENDKSTQVSENEKVILSPKEAPGPDSAWKEYQLEKLRNELIFVYMFYKDLSKADRKRGFSREEAFWINFAQISFDELWDDNAEVEVHLSEVLRLYLSIYREEINPHMTPEEEAEFLELLKERFYKVDWIIFESYPDNSGLKVFELGRFILGEDANVVRQVEVGQRIVEVANALADIPMPYKLVKDE